MKLKLLALTFLILSLAVRTTFATPSYIIHSSIPIWIPHYNPYAAGPTVYFGGGVYVWTDWNDLRITKFFVEDAGYSWFNYTVDYVYSGAAQRIYCSYHTVTALYVNDVLYLEDHPSTSCYWYESLGIVYVTLGGVSKPANVSIAYTIPPPVEMVSISVKAYNNSDYTEMSGGSIMVTDILGNSSTFSLPAMFSVIKAQTYTYTVYGDATWTFNNTVPGGTTNPFNWIFSAPFTISCFFDSQPEYNWIPVPIIFIIGMVGLGCMFVGPSYAINKIKQKEYRSGLVWGVIITALGFALFIAWLFGGNF